MTELLPYLAVLIIGLLAGMQLGTWLALRGRSAGQIVPASSGGQIVAGQVAPTSTPASAIPERPRTEAEQREFDRVHRNRVLAKLAQDFPGVGEGKRGQMADEIIGKARTLLARPR
jgi:hypothetical protein